MNTDLLLRVSSCVIFLTLLHQLFWSKGGGYSHRVFGKITICLGVVIAILVTIRGMKQEVSGVTYVLHLLAGGPFFICLFATGIFGYLARRKKDFASIHKFLGRATGVLLLLTLLLGVISKFSH